MMTDDMDLVRAYADGQSEPAFATLVDRYVNLVYSTALRQTGDPHLAEEITQAVFLILARKAGSLGPGTILPSWLHRTAGFVAADAIKARHRRRERESEAHMQSLLTEPSAGTTEAWPQIAPLLDAAIARLNETDRHAIILRYFENRSLADVGRALGANEDAARMRVQRALEKLRKYFSRRGVTSTTAILAGMISANSVQAAPAGLAQSVAMVAAMKGAAVSGSTLTLIKGALKLMAWTKMKTVVIAGLGVLLVGGTATIAVNVIKEHRPLRSEAMYNGKSVHDWVDQALWGMNPASAVETYNALRHIGAPAAELLVQALTQTNTPPGHPDFSAADVRQNAFGALEQMSASAKSQVPELIALLKYDDKDVRIWATLVLADIGPDAKSAIPALIAETKDPTYVNYAAEALKEIRR